MGDLSMGRGWSCDLPWGRSWCFVREESLAACRARAENIDQNIYRGNDVDVNKVKYWTYGLCEGANQDTSDLCGRPKCACSQTPMHPSTRAKEAYLGEKRHTYGSHCEAWDKGDDIAGSSWCF